MKNFTRTEDFTKDEYIEIFRRMKIFEKGLKEGKNYTHLCAGKVMATMFFQESARTSASLQAGIIKVGGGWFGISGIKGTYLESGEEDLEDTLNGVAPLCDIMAIRHKTMDLTEFAAKGFRVPLINAMCGGEEHTIGALIFTYLPLTHFGDLSGKKIGIYGMSKSSRPIKAAVKVLSHFGVEVYEDSVIPEFKLPAHIVEAIKNNGSTYQEEKMENFIDKVDYFFVVEGLPQSGEDENLINKFNEAFVPITNKHLERLKENAIISAGEPRSTTDGRLVILKETDNNPKVVGKDMIGQMVYGNMALITYLLGVDVE